MVLSFSVKETDGPKGIKVKFLQNIFLTTYMPLCFSLAIL